MTSLRRNRGLAKAENLFRKRKYLETIRILEPQVFTYRENPKFYYLLGISCLQTGDYAGAFSYLKRSDQLEPKGKDCLLGLAVVHLRRLEMSESIRIWLDILEDEPKNKCARAGLDLLKRNSQPEAIEALFDTGKVQSLIPSPGFFIPSYAKIALLLIFLLAAGFPLERVIQRKFFQPKTPVRPEISAVQINQKDRIVDAGEKASFMLTEKEITASFQLIKDLFEKYEDNLARKEINRLLLSNAGHEIKDKLLIFLPHISTPDFSSMKDSFTYQEVIKDPRLYEGCFVRWKGRVSNVKITDKEISFDFLVGYQDQKVLEGILRARMNFSSKVDPAFAYEVIGKIVPIGDKSIELKITSLHELGI